MLVNTQKHFFRASLEEETLPLLGSRMIPDDWHSLTEFAPPSDALQPIPEVRASGRAGAVCAVGAVNPRVRQTSL